MKPSRIRDLERQRIENLRRAGLCGMALIHEALLTRGFLVEADQEGEWLSRGSHPLDARTLEEMLAVEMLGAGARRMARLSLQPGAMPQVVARQILRIPENGGMTAAGPNCNRRMQPTWSWYRRIHFGAKLAVGPGRPGFDENRWGALDTGVALLVKTLPLLRVITYLSCDGHGRAPARVWLWTKWDGLWLQVLLKQRPPRDAIWTAHFEEESRHERDETQKSIGGSFLEIAPPESRFDDTGLSAMLESIRTFARSLLSDEVAADCGARRRRAFEIVGDSLQPSDEQWKAACEQALGL